MKYCMQVRFLSLILAATLSFHSNAQMFGASMSAGFGGGFMPMGMGMPMGGFGGTPWGMGGYGAQYCPYPMSSAPGATAKADALIRASRALKKAEEDKEKQEAKLNKLKAKQKKAIQSINAVLTNSAADQVIRHMQTGKNRNDTDYTQACGQGASVGTPEKPITMPPSGQPSPDQNRAIQEAPSAAITKKSAGRMPASDEAFCMPLGGKTEGGQTRSINLWANKYAMDNGQVSSDVCYENYSGVARANVKSEKREDCQEGIDEYLEVQSEIDEAKANLKALNAQIKELNKLVDKERDRLEAAETNPEAKCDNCDLLARQSAYKPSTGEILLSGGLALAGAGLSAWAINQSIQYNAKAGWPTNPLMVAMPGMGLLSAGMFGLINGGMAGGSIGCAGGGPFGSMGGMPGMGPSMLPMMGGPGGGGPFGYPPGMNPMMSGGAFLPGMMGSPYGGGYPGMMMGGPMGMPMGGPMMGGPMGYPMGGPMMGGPGMMMPGMGPSMLPMMGGPNMMMGNPMMAMNPMMGYNPMMGANPMLMNPMMGMNPMFGNPYMMNPMMGGPMMGGPMMGNSMYGNPYMMNGGMQMQMQMQQMQMQQMQAQQMYMQQMYQQQMYRQAAVSSLQQQIYSLQMQMAQISGGGGPSMLPYPGGMYGGGGYPMGGYMGGFGAYGSLGVGIGGGYPYMGGGYMPGPSVLPYSR